MRSKQSMFMALIFFALGCSASSAAPSLSHMADSGASGGTPMGPSLNLGGGPNLNVDGDGGPAMSNGGAVTILPKDILGYDPPAPVWSCGATCYADAGLDLQIPKSFDAGAAGGTAPTLLYPLADSLHPVNLTQITFQWRRTNAAQSAFRIRLKTTDKTYDFFATCTPIAGAEAGECALAMPEGNWLDIAIGHRGTAATVTIAGLDGNQVAESPPITIRFSSQAVTGGLYYWSTGIRGTYRLVFGQKTATPFIQPMTAANPTECGGCHAVSRDGSTIAFTEGMASGFLDVADTTTPDSPRIAPTAATKHDSSMVALSPNGKRVLTGFTNASRAVMELRDTGTGAVLTTVGSAELGNKGAPYFPEFSAKGDAVVLTLSSYPDAEWSVRKGSIAVVPFDAQLDTFGTAKVIVPEDGDFDFYPSFSPDGKWVVFASAPANANLISYNQKEARLRLVSSEGGRVYELGRATQGVGNASTWPKFAPFMQDDNNVLFITFNSKIDYGATLKNSLLMDQAKPQLWMAGIDLRNLASGDPSWAPVWLPFQAVDQNNHLGYWTELVTCKLGGCGSDELVCKLGDSAGGGTCVVQPPPK